VNFFVAQILSTNIAEVSVTINDVVVVIDSGKMKEVETLNNLAVSQLTLRQFALQQIRESLTGISSLSNVWVSKANALQRKGRSGLL